MLIVKNVSPRKVYINDLRILLNPNELADISSNEIYIRNNRLSKNLQSLIATGQLQVIQSDEEKSQADTSKKELLDLLKELLSDLVAANPQSETKSVEKSIDMNLDVGEINALIHSRTQIQDELKNSRIRIEDTDAGTDEDANTDELVELLRKQKEGAKDV
jgi:hypothetical protein